jgi:hypothetical protein
VRGGLKGIKSGRRGRRVMLDISFLLYGNSASLPVVRHAKYDPTVAAPTQKYDAVR